MSTAVTQQVWAISLVATRKYRAVSWAIGSFVVALILLACAAAFSLAGI
jgi:hypothetical protein